MSQAPAEAAEEEELPEHLRAGSSGKYRRKDAHKKLVDTIEVQAQGGAGGQGCQSFWKSIAKGEDLWV